MTQSFWVDGPLPGVNEIVAAAKGFGGRGTGYSKMKKEWTEKVFWRAKQAKLCPIGPCTFLFEWSEEKRNRDPDNFAAGKKFAIDGLVLAKVIRGDGWKWVLGFTDRWSSGVRPPGVLVTMVSEEPWMP